VVQEELELDMTGGSSERSEDGQSRQAASEQLLAQQAKFLDKAREVTTGQFLYAASQLCHMDTSLAESVWLDLFPRLWAILSESHRSVSPKR